MAIRITFLGHSGFVLNHAGRRVAIDPFLTGNPVAKHQPADLDVEAILLTHGHSDHLGDTVPIAQRTGAKVYAAFEVCNLLAELGVPDGQLERGNPGGEIQAPFGSVAFTQAFHSSSYEGRYTGQPTGIVARFAPHAGDTAFTFHHLGDTALFSDLKLLGEIYRPDVAAIPCGDRFTMGPALARRAAEFVRPKAAIPIHHSTWPLLTSDLSAFTPDGVTVRKMEPGATWEYA